MIMPSRDSWQERADFCFLATSTRIAFFVVQYRRVRGLKLETLTLLSMADTENTHHNIATNNAHSNNMSPYQIVEFLYFRFCYSQLFLIVEPVSFSPTSGYL